MPTLFLITCIMKQCTLNIALFNKLKCLPMCITSQFAKLIAHQIYHIYGMYVNSNVHNVLRKLSWFVKCNTTSQKLLYKQFLAYSYPSCSILTCTAVQKLFYLKFLLSSIHRVEKFLLPNKSLCWVSLILGTNF